MEPWLAWDLLCSPDWLQFMEIIFPLPSEFWIKVCATMPGRFGPLSHSSSRALINKRYLCVFGPLISITSSLGMGGESHLSTHPLPRAYHNSFLITWPPKSQTGRPHMGTHAHGIHSTLMYVSMCVPAHSRGQRTALWRVESGISLPPPYASPRYQTQVSLVPCEPFWLHDLTGLWILIHDFKL